MILHAQRDRPFRKPGDLWLEAPPGAAHRQAVLDGPVAAAVACLRGIRFSRPDVYDLRRLEAFAPDWFRRGFDLSFALAFQTLHDGPDA